jgi:hypothetical protein
MPDEGPQGRHGERPVTGHDSEGWGQPMPSVIPADPEAPSTAVPERRCWRCLDMFPGDSTREPTRTPDWWLCNPCDHVLLGAELRVA